MLLLLNWAGPALACRLASIVLQATAGGAYSPVRPILLLAVRPGGVEKRFPACLLGGRGRHTDGCALPGDLATVRGGTEVIGLVTLQGPACHHARRYWNGTVISWPNSRAARSGQ